MIKELKENEQIFIEEINNDLCNNIAIIQFRLDSYIKLFTSYWNNTSEVANEMNLNIFLNTYSNECAEMEIKRIELLEDILKEEYQYFLSNSFRYILDEVNKTLRITKLTKK